MPSMPSTVIRRLARTAGVASAAAMLALTAACGSSGSTSSSDSSGSSDGGQDAAALTKANLSSELAAALKKAGSYSFTIKSSAGGMSTTGSGKADTDASTAEAAVTSLGQQVQVRLLDGFLYLKGSAFGTDKWIKVDLSDKSGPGALFAGSADPSKQLAVLSEASKVTKQGSEQVDGVDTTEYAVTVPGSAIAKNNATLKQLASALPKTVTYDIFVDSDNLLRKFDNELTVQGQKVETEIGFSDFGKDVSIEAPPAGQTTTKFNFGNLGGSTTS